MAPGDRGEQFRVESGAGKHPYFTKKYLESILSSLSSTGLTPACVKHHWSRSWNFSVLVLMKMLGIAFSSVKNKQYSFSYQPCYPTTTYCNLQFPNLLPKAGSALNSDQVALDFVWLVENLWGRRCHKQLPG